MMLVTYSNMEIFNFKGDNPGAVQYGNFINYYQFHPPENRLELLPSDIWDSTDEIICYLDIGCNAGDLTIKLHSFLESTVKKSCHMLAVDIDPVLIDRAREKNSSSRITFECMDFMDSHKRSAVIIDYLTKNNISKFTTTFCFSTTMWIHLNHGDEGLHTFLSEIYKISKMVVIEPQPWKCYKTAVKRMKLSSEEFPLYKELKIRENVDNAIELIFLRFGNVLKIYQTEKTKWNRKIIFLKTLE